MSRIEFLVERVIETEIAKRNATEMSELKAADENAKVAREALFSFIADIENKPISAETQISYALIKINETLRVQNEILKRYK